MFKISKHKFNKYIFSKILLEFIDTDYVFSFVFLFFIITELSVTRNNDWGCDLSLGTTGLMSFNAYAA